ncbi:MAG: mitochondrial carrier domain-containing protein [Piptocephalis tieghemiana]|nr:MAG: mitochondrial carrier domain-containing protein [Piptocephalis tieghemiana]
MIPVLAIVVPRVSLQFTGLALFTPWLSRAEKAGWSPQGSAPALAGILTGMAQATLLVTPLELIKVRQQTTIGAHQGPLALVLHVIREEGQVLFFLPCLLPTMIRQSWGLALKFSFYARIRSALGADKEEAEWWRSAAAGGMANVLVGILNSPPDVLKTRMQDKGSLYPSTWACAKDVWATAGLSGFFRGASLRVLRIAPGGAIQFMVYEQVASHLDQWSSSSSSSSSS